jgi:hypothetical protein
VRYAKARIDQQRVPWHKTFLRRCGMLADKLVIFADGSFSLPAILPLQSCKKMISVLFILSSLFPVIQLKYQKEAAIMSLVKEHL